MDDFSKAVCLGAHNQVRLADPSAQALLTQMLERKDAPVGWSIPVPGDAAHVPFVIHMLPLRGAARDVFSGAKSVLYVTPVQGQKPPAVELLEALFDLTPAEARIAGLIAEGQTVDSITSTLSVSANTVRTHLKSIFSKTGVGRQAELVTLLSTSALRTPHRKLND
jgi:DNA-binding CsgD family transcriptional regulator